MLVLQADLGAGNRVRTGGLDLGKVALYQLSYTRFEGSAIFQKRQGNATPASVIRVLFV